MIKLFWIMVGGALGAVCRYGFGLLGVRLFGAGFPWGTLMSNMTGCLLIGMAFGLIDRAQWFTPLVRLFFMTGFLGALTTFSSYALESVNLMRSGSYAAVTNFLINNLGGLVFVLAGMGLVQRMMEGR